MRNLFVFLLIISIFGTSCIKRKEFPDEPIIKYLDFIQTKDTAYLRFSFTDGNGDLGLDQADTLSPFDIKGSNYYNVYINYFEKVNGIFKEISLSAPYNYRFKRISSPGRSKALEGEMKIKIPAPYYNPLLEPGDTVKYEFYIKDRTLNSSNTESTGPVVIQY